MEPPQGQRNQPEEHAVAISGEAKDQDADKRVGKPCIKDLNEHIVCSLCRGYLIDATTLVECLHSFCRGCIVRRLQAGPKICPICSASAQAPLIPDVGLQRLVYLVVPGLFRSEQERRRHFRQVNPQCVNLNQPPLGAPDLSFDDLVSLSLCEIDSTNEGSTRYLKCPAGVTVRHLLRLLMLKRGWDDTEGKSQQCGNNKIEMMYEVSGNGLKVEYELLDPSWTLMDLSCIYEWKRETPMKLLYRIVRIEEPTANNKSLNNSCTSDLDNSSGSSALENVTINSDANNQAIENIQRPPTPPPSPKPAISRIDTLDKNLQPPPAPPTTTVVEQYSTSKEHEPKKPRCEVTPVMRAPDPLHIDEPSKSGKLPKLEHQHKRKKRRNKRVIAEITTTPREDLLKLKFRLTPCPPRVTSSNGSGSQTKEKLMQIRAMRKEKTKSANPQKHRIHKEHKSNEKISEEINISDKEEFTVSQESASVPEKEVKVAEVKEVAKTVTPEENNKLENEEPPKNEEVLRRLGLIAISEASRTRQERAKSPTQSSNEKSDPAIEREKLEKQLRESKANRVRSLLAEKQMRDTLKSIMSNSKETNLTNNPASTSSSSTSRSGTPTTNNAKRKEPPPLTPLRNAKRPNVTFAPSSFITGKYESPLDLSSPSSIYKDNVLDLSPNVSDITISKCNPKDKPVSILRTSFSRPSMDKSKEEIKEPSPFFKSVKKTHDSNLRTLSDAAVSLLGDRSTSQMEQAPKLPQNFIGGPGNGGSNVAGKVALRIPQPHQRITGFGMKIKPNIGVRHIPNPQAVVASQYRNQRTGYFNLAHQPP